MTTDDRSLERAARSWLESGPTQAPEHAVVAALERIQTTSQERDLRIPWRLPKMNLITRLAGAAIVGVLAVGIAWFALRPGSSVGVTPTPTPPASNAPSPSTSDSVSALRAYRGAFDAVCASLTPVAQLSPSAAPEDLVVFLRATIATGTDEAARLEAIQAPPALLTDHLANIQTLKDTLALLRHEIDLIQANKMAEATAVDEATGSLSSLREQFAAKYGLSTRCP